MTVLAKCRVMRNLLIEIPPQARPTTLVITDDLPEPMVTSLLVGGGLIYLDQAKRRMVASLRTRMDSASWDCVGSIIDKPV
jgi:hypothetical protein